MEKRNKLSIYIEYLTLGLFVTIFSIFLYSAIFVYAEDDSIGKIHEYFIDNPSELDYLNSVKTDKPYCILTAPNRVNPLASGTGKVTYFYCIFPTQSNWIADGNNCILTITDCDFWEFNSYFQLVRKGQGTLTFNATGTATRWNEYPPILYSNYNLSPLLWKGVSLGGGDINIGDSIYPYSVSYDGNLPLVALSYYGDYTSRNNTVFIPRFSLLTDPSTDTINTDGTWNTHYTVEYSMDLFVASHDYANSVYSAYVDAEKDINNIRFQNALAEILRTAMPLSEATQTVTGTITPFSNLDFVTSPELLFYRPLSSYMLISPITISGATDADKNALAPYLYRIKSISARLVSGNYFGKSTVNAYSVKQSFLTTYTYSEELTDDRNKAIEDSLADAQDRYNELLSEYNAYVIDRQRLDAFSASETWYDIDIGKTAMQVIDIFDSMVDVISSFADYTTMFMAWIPVSVLRLFVACLILNCIVSLYHALRG